MIASIVKWEATDLFRKHIPISLNWLNSDYFRNVYENTNRIVGLGRKNCLGVPYSWNLSRCH